jgi:glycogen operon protein
VLRQSFPILRRSRFLTGEYNADLDVRDVRWMSPSGQDIEDTQWGDANARCFGMLLDGRAQASGIKRPAMDATALLVLNAHHDVVNFAMPDIVGGSVWRCLLDTNNPDDVNQPFQTGEAYEITGRSLVLFVLEPESKRSVALRRAIEGFRQVAERPIPVATPEPGPEAEMALSPGTGTTRP